MNPTRSRAKLGGVFTITCRNKNGRVKWTDQADNLVVNEGLNHILDVVLLSGTQDTTWFIGLTDGTPTVAAGDTLASHAGWVEVTAYSEGTRQAYSGTRTGQQVSNSANKASFSINANGTTMGGAFLTGVNSGTAGTLLSVAAFTGGDKSADSGDTLEVTYNFSAADDGV